MSSGASMHDPFWSLHVHSKFSAGDAIGELDKIVPRAAELGYPALGLTDHGTMAGIVQFYKLCRKHEVNPLPGLECYLTFDAAAQQQWSMHLTVAAYTAVGYRNLTRLATLCHRNFYYRPRVDMADLADLAAEGYLSGLLVGTGCRSGPVVRTLNRQGPKAAQRVAENLAMWFPRVYIELMNHGITEITEPWGKTLTDEEICEALIGISERSGLPYIVTSDSHYVMPNERAVHDQLKELVTWSEDPLEGRFLGSGYHLPDRAYLLDRFSPWVLDTAIANLTDLAAHATVTIPELDTFKLKVPDVTGGGDADDILGAVALELCETKFPGDAVHAQRVVDELAVIGETDMASYLLFVKQLTDHMTEVGIWFWARGSVGGSLVTYLLGISQDNPLDRTVRMDRFLSGDRTSVPDVDLDIDRTRRAEMIEWVTSLYAVAQVANYVRYRLDPDPEEQSGSLKVAYFSTLRKAGVYVKDDARIPPDDWKILVDLGERGIVRNIGTNAAGFIVATHESDLDIIPKVRIKEGRDLLTAFDKDDMEPTGFPKIDLLGSRMLHGLRVCCTLLDPEAPIPYFDAIPDDDAPTMERVRSAKTTGMFQLGGWTQTKGMEELQPVDTDEIIASQALYRTGVSREFLQTYLRRRAGYEPTPTAHEDIAAELDPTYGVALFQEQVVGILRRIGMPAAELTAMLKAVKSSGRAGLVKAQEAVREALPAILELSRKAGWSNDDVAWLEAAITDYAAGYSFGKAHSIRYGLVAYRTAWLLTHHPLEYWTGMLTAYTGYVNQRKVDVEKHYVNAAKTDGLRVLGAHVNHSKVDYEAVDERTIRTGLISVHGVGHSAAAEIVAKAPYASLADLGKRVLNSKVSGAKDLAIAGAIPVPTVDMEGKSKEPSTVIWHLHKAGALSRLK